jgi:hypothetical protein
MNMIERHRLVRDGILPTPTEDEIAEGYVCAICWRPTEEMEGPRACSECGGDATLLEDDIEEAINEAGQFGVGA